MSLQQTLSGFWVNYGGKIIEVSITLFIGYWIIKLMIRITDKGLRKSKIDISLHSFIKSIINIGLRVVLFLTIASMLNVPIATFLAVLSAAGLAVGLALKDSLTNFAGGILILLFRPFGVGDYIESQGFSGTVKEIQLLYTYLNTIDNKKVIIPNGDLANGKIINYSTEKDRRLDLTFSIGYEEDILKAKNIINEIVIRNTSIYNEPAPFIGVAEHGVNSIKLVLKVWCNNKDYWDIYYYLLEEVKLAFDREGILIPYAQMDVHLINK